MGIIYGIEKLVQRNEKYEVVENDIVEGADVCIIGSGAAGSVLAKELVETGKRVILLERGGYHEGKDMNQRDADMIPLLWKNSGFNFDRYYDKDIERAPHSIEPGVTANSVIFFKPITDVDKVNVVLSSNFEDYRFNNVTVE